MYLLPLSLLHPANGALDFVTSVSVSEPAMRRTCTWMAKQVGVAVVELNVCERTESLVGLGEKRMPPTSYFG